MSRHIGTIEGCDIVEQDDKSVTFTAAARLDGDGANGQFGQPPCYAPASFTVNEASPHPANSGGTESHTIRYQLFPGTAATVNGVAYRLQRS